MKKFTIELERWEAQHISDLAHLVLNSKQNVGTALLDKAKAVRGVFNERIRPVLEQPVVQA